MAVISSSRFIFFTISCLCLIIAVSCRPQTTIDSQDTMSSDQDNSEIRRLYNAYYNYPGAGSFSPEERIALNRLQYEMLANYVQNGMPDMGAWSETKYRSPEIKRQVRYRQCYFNPISCFRK